MPKHLCFGVQMETQQDADAEHQGQCYMMVLVAHQERTLSKPLEHTTVKEAMEGLAAVAAFRGSDTEI